jgi:hypothetical protein
MGGSEGPKDSGSRVVSIPKFEPMPLASLKEPFGHADWIFELKHDGYRAGAYIDSGHCRLGSRRGAAYKSFPQLCDAIPGQAVLDGEIVHLDGDGKPQFYDLMRRLAPKHFYAFDLLWLDGRGLRDLPFIERERVLRSLARPPVLYADHRAPRRGSVPGCVRPTNIGPARLTAAVEAPATTHELAVDGLQAWLDTNGKTPLDQTRKVTLR